MNDNSNSITVSIVSHGHGVMVWNLLSQIILCNEVKKVIITLNIPEEVPNAFSEKVLLIKNNIPKGFGSNHNFAFTMVTTEYFCVLNPDIIFLDNPFQNLIKIFANNLFGLVAPLIKNTDGTIEDTTRKDISLWFICKRIIGLEKHSYTKTSDSKYIYPNWIGGMFMMFRSSVFKKLDGFDENFFMYCEDADICRRLRKIGYQIVVSVSENVIHNARRASHQNFQHFMWHVQSLKYYLMKHR